MSQVITLIISIINDKKVNPFNGSVPIEKIIDILKNNHYNLYYNEIKLIFNKDIDFFIYYSYYFRIIIDYEKVNKKRIALINNKYWKINDKIEKRKYCIIK